MWKSPAESWVIRLPAPIVFTGRVTGALDGALPSWPALSSPVVAPGPHRAVRAQRQAEIRAGRDLDDADQPAHPGRRDLVIAGHPPAQLAGPVVAPGPHRAIGPQGRAEVTAGRHLSDP